MNCYDSLNKLMDAIEKNLEKNISYQELAKVIGTSSYAMQRIFAFLTNITLTEYIRKRRLSKAAEELKKTDHKIIEIAMKYGYDSPVSFSNAFKKMFGQTPANFRKSDLEIIFFPKIQFNPAVKGLKELTYRIVEREEQILYGKRTKVIQEYDSKSIRDLYEQIEIDGTKSFMLDHAKGKELYYGIFQTIYNKDRDTKKERYYYIASKISRKDFIEVKIPKAKWACFRIPNHRQEDINKLGYNIYDKWLPDSEYYLVSQYPELEIYYENYCEICVAVE